MRRHPGRAAWGVRGASTGPYQDATVPAAAAEKLHQWEWMRWMGRPRPPLGWAGLGRAGQSIRFSRASCSGFHASAPWQPIALLPSTSARAPTSAPPLRANNRRGRITSAPVQGRAGARGNTGSGALEGPIVLLGGALRTTRALPDGCWAQPCGRHLISSLTAQRNAMQRGEVRCETCCAEQPGRRRAFLLADGCSLLLGHLLGQSEGAWTVRDGPINGICLGDGEPQPTRPSVPQQQRMPSRSPRTAPAT